MSISSESSEDTSAKGIQETFAEHVDESDEWPPKGTIKWKDCVYLTEVLAVNPWACKRGESEAKWREITNNFQDYGNNLSSNWKSIRDRVNSIIKEHVSKTAHNASASGISESYDMRVKLLDSAVEMKESGPEEKDIKK